MPIRPTEHQIITIVAVLGMYRDRIKEDHIAKSVGLHHSAVQKILRIVARFSPRFNNREVVFEVKKRKKYY